MHLQSKQTSETCAKIVDLDGKAEQNRLKMVILLPFFFSRYLLKSKNH